MFGSERFAGAPSFGGATALHEEQTPPGAIARRQVRRIAVAFITGSL